MRAYPARWIGKVTRATPRDGRKLQARVDEPKGDPGNTLSRAELEDKAMRLAAYQRRRQRGRDARASRSACGPSPTRRASSACCRG